MPAGVGMIRATTRSIARRRPTRSYPSLLLFLAALLVLRTDRIDAANVSWIVDANGSWTMTSNWSGNVVPGAADDVTIDVAGDRTIFIPLSNQSVKSLICNEKLTLSGGVLN